MPLLLPAFHDCLRLIYQLQNLPDKNQGDDDNGGLKVGADARGDGAISMIAVHYCANVHAHDIAILDANTLSVSYVDGLMNLNMALAVNPVTNHLSVVGTEAIREEAETQLSTLLASPVRLIGRHGLLVFASGTVLALICQVAMTARPEAQWMPWVLPVIGTAALYGIAWVAETSRQVLAASADPKPAPVSLKAPTAEATP